MDKQEKISQILKKIKSGNIQEVLTELLHLIKENPDILEYTQLYGKICYEINNLDEAEKVFLSLIKKNKQSLEYLKNLYIIYLKKNNLVSAEKTIVKILTINSKDYSALRDLGYIKFLKNNFTEAKLIYEKINKEISKDVFALNIYGLINYFIGDLDEAVKQFIKAINFNPNYIDSYNNLGKIYFDKEDLNNAFNNFKKAYKLNKDLPNTLINIGNILSLKDKNYNSILAYKKALKDTNKKGEVLANISIAYSRIKDLDNSIKYYNKAIKYSANNASLKLSLSYLYLYKNEFSNAWKFFDARIQNSKFFRKKYNPELISYILKCNQNFSQKDKVLILREQGVGEEILFSSLYNDLIKYSDNITIEADPRLLNIFERSFNKKIFVKDGKFSKNIESLKKFDTVIFAGSLCKKFRRKNHDFKNYQYLLSDKKKDKKIYSKLTLNNKKIKVGLSWKSVVSIYGNLKSLNLNNFKKLFKNDRQIINLQYGNTEKEIKEFENENCKIYTFNGIDLFNNIEDCMSILKNIDVFVTISNSTAHIAAAMGVRTILICPKKSSTYFYWSNENGSTLWYENVTILKVSGSVNKTINKIDKILDQI
ncbi:tetratricopeptide repeat protein [Alphaproteobacteria bacterium]|nr:tetratricopeptide repeat protein [Alphaproteobacteria bacterium]